MVRNKKRVNLIGRFLFVVYMFLALYFMFFSETLDRKMISSDYRYNLVIGAEIRRFWNMRYTYGWHITLVNLLGNIVCFIPFGLLFPTLSYKRGYKNFITVTLLAIVFSVLIETAQLIAKVGAFDVDDIILNTLGSVVGYIIFIIGRGMVKGKKRKR